MSGLVSRLLTETHRLNAFDCGKEPLNVWLQAQSLRAQAAGTARTYVWTSADELDALAYFAVAPTQLVRNELPTKGIAGGFSTVPGYLLARLALDKSLIGQGLGTELLLDALTRIVQAARISGGRLIAVDAIDEQAHAFYRRHDFIPVKDSDRLYLKVATAGLALGQDPTVSQRLISAVPPPRA